MAGKFTKTNWWIQRLSGLLLFILLLWHFFLMHFANAGELTYEWVYKNFNDYYIFYRVEVILFLILALYHGLGGIRMVVMDFSISKGFERAIFWVFLFAGAVLFLWGTITILGPLPSPNSFGGAI